MKYKHTLKLYKLYNSTDETSDWMDLNMQQNFNNRNQNEQIVDYPSLKVLVKLMAYFDK